MSSKSITITESQILDTMQGMCVESLPPELFEQWEKISVALRDTRSGLKGIDTTE